MSGESSSKEVLEDNEMFWRLGRGRFVYEFDMRARCSKERVGCHHESTVARTGSPRKEAWRRIWNNVMIFVKIISRPESSRLHRRTGATESVNRSFRKIIKK